MTAGLFPLIHLGRLWVFYYILPYPSERQLWPNFTSPLVLGRVRDLTYLTVSPIFFYVGLMPDLAAARDRWRETLGSEHLAHAPLPPPGAGLVRRGQPVAPLRAGVSVLRRAGHAAGRSRCTRWCRGTSPWASCRAGTRTIFAPYFVAGAIHSGLAMVLTLLIPMRRLLHLERIITADHLEAVAKTMLVTALIVGYAYIVEPFMAWYSAATSSSGSSSAGGRPAGSPPSTGCCPCSTCSCR